MDGEIDWALTPGTSTKKPPVPAAETEVVAKVVTNGAAKSNEVDGGIDSDDEEALEEALKLAEQEVNAEEEVKK